jgi:hypothetical protein
MALSKPPAFLLIPPMLLAMFPIVEEDDMPDPQSRPWRVRRQTSPHADGQRRWDRAYLALLQWTQSAAAPVSASQSAIRLHTGQEEEESHDGRFVCTRLDPAAISGADD